MSSWVDVTLIPLKVVGGVADTKDLMAVHPIILEDDTVPLFIGESLLITVKWTTTYTAEEMVLQFILEVLRD
jgi:hypothetical protein